MSARGVVTRDGRPAVYARDRSTWRRWLARNHAKSTGVWLVYGKRASGIPSVTYAEAVEEALCFGWIDSVVNQVDAARYMQLMTPRKPKSVWSKINKARVEKLIASGAMTAAGLTAIDRAKANGSWASLDDVEALTLPDELARGLARDARARRNFDAWPPGARKQFLYWINGAKRPETRRKRIEQSLRLIAENVRLTDPDAPRT